VSGSDITGNGTVNAPYLTITNAQAIDIANYNNLYTIVVERGIFDYKNANSLLLTNNSSMYFYAGVVVTNTSFGIFQLTNTTVTVSGSLTMYPGGIDVSQCSNVVANIGLPNAPMNYFGAPGSFLIYDNASTLGDAQNIYVNMFVNSFSASLMYHTKQFTNSVFHVTAYYPSTMQASANGQSGNLATYPYTNNETFEITCPQITCPGSAANLWYGYYKLILDPMVFICSTYPSVSQTNILLVARDVEFTTWPTNLLLNSPPNLFTNTFWP
jgi:hypothetical protein